jgi:hypothetical protein
MLKTDKWAGPGLLSKHPAHCIRICHSALRVNPPNLVLIIKITSGLLSMERSDREIKSLHPI